MFVIFKSEIAQTYHLIISEFINCKQPEVIIWDEIKI